MSTDAVPTDYLQVLAKCKFCHIPLTLRIDPDGANSPMFNIEKMLPFAACNRCADYYTKVRSLGEIIRDVALTFLSKRKSDAEARSREQLERQTKSYVGLVCDHYRVPRQWDKEFSDIIVEKPESVYIILRAYRKQIMANARQQPRLPHAD